MSKGKSPRNLGFVVLLLQWFHTPITQGISLEGYIEFLRYLLSGYEHGERKGEGKRYEFSQGITRFSLSKLSHNPQFALLGFSHVVPPNWNRLDLVQD